MSMISFTQRGDFKETERFLDKAKRADFYKHLESYAQMGVEALREATPIDSGKTAESWGYEINVTKNKAEIIWTNSNTNDGENIAILIQYGHGTGTGGYVQGRDYVNPAMAAVFDKIAVEMWKEVTAL